MRREIRQRPSALAPEAPLDVERGETVGVVLLGPGGPDSKGDIPQYLYRLLMDPASEAVPGPCWVRHFASRFMAWRGKKTLAAEYEAIGGRAPIVRHAYEQAHAVQSKLGKRTSDVTFRTYVAMRYGNPSTEEALERMADDGVEKAILLPLFPQYALSRTGSSLAFWAAAARRARKSPTISVVRAYAEEPAFVQALSERIDEALQRFPRDGRSSVRYVFVAHGAVTAEKAEKGSAYCCQVHRTVDAVMRLRGFDRPFSVAFKRPAGLGNYLEPLLENTLTELADKGERSVLVIPVSIVTEQIDIAYRLDVSMRRYAESNGISRYEVAAPLNCHPLLLESLVRSISSHVRVDGSLLHQPSLATGAVGTCPRSTWGSDGASTTICRNCGYALGEPIVEPALMTEPQVA